MFGSTNSMNAPTNTFQFSPERPVFGFGSSQTGSASVGSNTSVATNASEESFAPLLTEDVLEWCKCSYCNCYISVGTARMIENKITCGRCKRESEGVRLMIVEALAKQFSFPCRYKGTGCNMVLKWMLMDSHEKVCDFKEIHCTIADCNWIGAKSSLKLHFEQKHICEIINSQRGITINLHEKKTSNFLYISKHKSFLTLLSNDGENIYHQVKFFCTSLEACMYIYDIYVYDSEKKLAFLNQKLQSFDDDVGMFNRGLSISVLQSVFINSNNINISFQIKYTNNEVATFSAQNIECPVCFEPMMGNIVIGMCGHSVCEQCKSSLKNCACCRSSTVSSGVQPVKPGHPHIRNYYLETLIKKLNLDI